MVTLDAGSKALAAEAGSPVAKVLGRCNGVGALDALGPSEEHLPLRFRDGDAGSAARPLAVSATTRGPGCSNLPRGVSDRGGNRGSACLRLSHNPPLRVQRGDELLLFPRHICPTVNMYDEAVLIEDGK
eukprot:SAG11_NODE_10287_length_842_cov_0.664872_1_plen_128_part_01